MNQHGPPALMTGFFYQNADLVCDEVPLASIASAVGTPCYVYSAPAIRAAYVAFDAAFGSYPHVLHYAFKANSTLAIVRLIRTLGAGVDANSGGEIDVALRAGYIPPDIVFTGVGKTHDELERAVALGVKAINVESPGECDRIDAIARAQGTRARVAVRVNPDIDARTHSHIATGQKTDKFGVPIAEASALYRDMAARTGLKPIGIHVHVGSQILTVDPLRRAAESVARLAVELRDSGIRIEHLDLGGGLGISYDGSPAPSPADYAAALLPIVQPTGLALVLEPGRAIVGPAGALVARVADVKEHPGRKHLVVLDAGMTEILRPALYGAFHRIEPVVRHAGREELCDFVGPVCESSDTLGRDRRMAPPRVGDLVAILDAGAYGSVMASNYNRRPQPAEVLVDAGVWRTIRRRQTIDDLLACEE